MHRKKTDSVYDDEMLYRDVPSEVMQIAEQIQNEEVLDEKTIEAMQDVWLKAGEIGKFSCM